MTGKLTWIRNSSWMNTIGRISFRELFSIFFPVSRKAQHKMTTNLLEWKVECKLYDRCKHVNLANVMSCATLHWLKCLQSITILVRALLPIKPQLWLYLCQCQFNQLSSIDTAFAEWYSLVSKPIADNHTNSLVFYFPNNSNHHYQHQRKLPLLVAMIFNKYILKAAKTW